MAEKSNADLGNGEVTESPPVTTAKPVPLQKQPGEVNINLVMRRDSSPFNFRKFSLYTA